MMKRVLLLLALGASTAPALRAAGPADAIRMRPLVRDGQVFVTFELAGGLTDEVRETIRSGLPTTFVYEFELRRGVPLWIDRTLAVTTVTATVQYDNLTRRHQLSRTIDGRVEPAEVTESDSVAERWLTSFERLPLFSTNDLEANVEYYVRVRAQARPRSTWSLWPWASGGASGHTRFTFLP